MPATASASGECEYDPFSGQIVCEASGGDLGDPPADPPDPESPAVRYLYTRFEVGGECYYWSSVPGGLDSWDPADDGAVIAITTSLPECPPTPPDPTDRAWAIFRSWDLDPPEPTITPPGTGITGLPSQVAAAVPSVIVHDEVLPDGRTLRVRASVTWLIVQWGDGTATGHRPEDAIGHPDGTVAHSYTRKTCSTEYRQQHPSGGLCHPTLEAYTITATFTWSGEFDVGAGWLPLGTLDRSTSVPYDVDEAVGIVSP